MDVKRRDILDQKNEFEDGSLKKVLFEKTEPRQVRDTLHSTVTSLKDAEKSIHSFTSQTIYSEKHLAALRDSIEKATGIPIPKNIPTKKELSEADMLALVNQKFPGTPSALRSQNEATSTAKDSLEAASPGVDKVPNLNSLKLPLDALQQLSPLPGSLVKSKYLKGLDSLRRINLSDEKLKYEERAISERAKLGKIQEKPTFRQRSYFEGVLGLVTGKSLTLYQASPSLGYHFTNSLSLGAGPTVQVIAVEKEVKFNGGVRAFSKVEFLKRQLYLQLEDQMNPWSPRDERIALDKHNVMVGGGVLLSMKAPITLNFSMMYRLNESTVTMSDLSPLVFRIGISSVKIQK
jgi:hypothetical protein